MRMVAALPNAIWMGGRHTFGNGIAYSSQENAPGGDFNEILNSRRMVCAASKPMGMPMLSNCRDEALKQGAAEYY
jgi:hypothetical protein